MSAISLSESNVETGQVAIHPEKKAVGIYVEKAERFTLGGTRRVNESSPEYIAYFQKALQAVPKPPTPGTPTGK